MVVSVFKTNAQKNDVYKLHKTFSAIRCIYEWNIDFEDCDKVLRIESKYTISKLVIKQAASVGITCQEMN